jgi:hypothetical protein
MWFPSAPASQLCAAPHQECGPKRVLVWEIDPATQPHRVEGIGRTSDRMWCEEYPAWPTSDVPIDAILTTSRMISSVSDAGYLIRGRPILCPAGDFKAICREGPIMLFLSKRSSSVCSATTSFRSRASWRRSLTSSVVAARAVSPASRRFPAP